MTYYCNTHWCPLGGPSGPPFMCMYKLEKCLGFFEKVFSLAIIPFQIYFSILRPESIALMFQR